MRLRSGVTTFKPDLRFANGENDRALPSLHRTMTNNENSWRDLDETIPPGGLSDAGTNGVYNQSVRNGDDLELRPHNRWVVAFLKLAGWTLISFYFIFPFVLRLYPQLVSEVAFLNKVHWPPFADLKSGDDLGLNGIFDLTIPTKNDVQLGAWHIFPASDQTIPSLSDGHPVIMYLHGNAGTRAGWHRVQLYRVLAKHGYHVITFDYRGYGDTPGRPSELSLFEDALHVFTWIQKKVSDKTPIYVWGHSLGSGVAARVSRHLSEVKNPPHAVVLESPFNNFKEAASNHPFSLPFRQMPWFSWCFIEALKYNDITFASDESIKRVTSPVLILHAKDDGIVPYALGLKLFHVAEEVKGDSVKLISFEGTRGFGHKHIHKAPELPEIIKEFFNESR